MIEFRNITKDFKSDFWASPFRALSDVSFQVKPGKIVGFLGANGAGKTTSIKILLGFIESSSGTIHYSKELGTKKKEIFRNIGYLPERPYFYPDLTGRELLQYVGEMNGLENSKIQSSSDKWASQLKIDFALDRKLKNYSKGMLQRLGFTSALLSDPKLLVLDEPLSGLDPIGRKEFKDIMNSISGEDRTIFFSSHILNDVEEVCSEVVVLEQGKLVYDGNIEDLIKSKTETKEYELILSNPIDEIKINFVKSGSSAKYNITEDKLDEVLTIISKSENSTLEQLNRMKPSLEDIIYKEGL